ncbi:MAG: MFS transporter [Pirellulales bacterium]
MHQPSKNVNRPSNGRTSAIYGGLNIFMASLAMTATLPGRTHGLGLITEPLLADLQIVRTQFAQMNFWSCLLGASFCLPIGWLVDRLGVRMVVAAVTSLLAAAVFWMGRIDDAASLFATLLLVRGLGQSALSVVSMLVISKWFSRRLGLAMGVFSVLLTFGFIGSILGMGELIRVAGWRDAWVWLAYALFALAPVLWLLVRDEPRSSATVQDEAAVDVTSDLGDLKFGFTLRQTLRTPAFWVFVLGTSAFNLVWSSVMLFNESILAERGVDVATAVEIMAILTGVGLIANLAAGAVASRHRAGRLLGGSLAVLAVALGLFPRISTPLEIRAYAFALGATGGVITVVFFAIWGHTFGRAHLGRIQGVSQLFTVLASAIGPVLMAECMARTGSYMPMFQGLAIGVGVLAVAALATPLPS